MKRLALFFCFLVLAAPAWAGPVDRAANLLEQGQFQQGLDLLHQLRADPMAPPTEHALAALALGDFWATKAGNYMEARRWYQKALQDGGQAGQTAQQRLENIRLQEKTYPDIDLLLAQARTIEPQARETIEIIDKLATLEQTEPDYYRMAEAQSALGSLNFHRADYKNALIHLDKALALAPAMGLAWPVETLAAQARQRQKTQTFHRAAYGSLWLMGLVLAALFFISRPWQWAGPLHLALPVVLAVLWAGVYYGTFALLAQNLDPAGALSADSNAASVNMVQVQPWDTGGRTGHVLFYYGLAGILGIALFSLAAAQWKKKWTAALAGYWFAWFWLMALGGVFSIQNLEGKSFFESPRDSALGPAKGHYYVELNEPEPFILTNPRAYPDVRTEDISDPFLLEWVKQYLPQKEVK